VVATATSVLVMRPVLLGLVAGGAEDELVEVGSGGAPVSGASEPTYCGTPL